jgi:hypothetical protein
VNRFESIHPAETLYPKPARQRARLVAQIINIAAQSDVPSDYSPLLELILRLLLQLQGTLLFDLTDHE